MAVYFIFQLSAGEPLLKIGRAKDIYQRRDALQTGNPHTLVLVGWIESDAESLLEAELHRKHHGVGTQNGPRYTLRFCRAFDGAHLAKRSERGGWRIGIGPEVIAGEIDMLPTER